MLSRLAVALLCLIMTAGISVAAGRTVLDGHFIQGGLAFGKTEKDARVEFDGVTVRVSPKGNFVIGFHRDDPAEMVLKVTYADGSTEAMPIAVRQRDYNIQRIDGLPPSKVTPPEALLKRIRSEAAKVRAVRKIDRDETWFMEGFVWPAQGRLSGFYGSQRVLNGQPKQPHYGVDVAAPVGTPVVAPASGIITLAEKDLYYSGGTVILDHGHGLASAFLHMQTVEVGEGQFIRQGQRIGTIGATGRATGPHLDWRINWFEKRIDPQLLVPEMGPAAN